MAERGLIALAFLLLLDMTVAQTDDNVKDSLNGIRSELAFLTRTVHDLKRENEDQSKKISGLENELAFVRQQNTRLYENQIESQKRIRQLEATVDELKDGVDVRDENVDEINGGTWLSNLGIPSKGDNRIDTTDGENSGPGRRADGTEAGNLTETVPKFRKGNSKGRRAVEEITQVAFSALISPHDYGPLGTNQIVDFDIVLINIGNAYHAHSGIFTAPVGGVYVISATISGWQHSLDHNYLEIRKNGPLLCKIWAASGDQSSQMLLLNLQANDEIYITNNRATDVILGDTYSSFSGFLLYPSGENMIIG